MHLDRLRSARRVAVAFLLAAVVVVLFARIYVGMEHPAYLWDYGAYFHKFKDFGELIAQKGWVSAFETLRQSVFSEDYNLSGVVPLMPIYALGDSRAVYVGGILALYLVPAAFVATALALARTQSPVAGDPLVLLSALLYPVFWVASLRGMIDVVGLIPLGFAAVLVLRTEYLTRASFAQAVIYGLLLWCAFLLRRWYAFSVVALMAVSFGAAVVSAMKQNTLRQAAPRIFLLNCVAGIACLLPAVVFQSELIHRILSTSYSAIYSAYQSDVEIKTMLWAGYFGVAALGLVALGLVTDLLRRRFESLFGLAVAAATIAMFSRVQAPGPQHILPVGLFLFPAYARGLQVLTGALPRLLQPVPFVVVCAAFVSTLLPGNWGPLEGARVALPAWRYPPLHLENYPEYRRLINTLVATGPQTKIAVFASSAYLSDSLLAELDDELRPKITWASQVDSRDGFNWETLSADYFVIGTPTPLHLSPEGQRVITLPASEIANRAGFGAALEMQEETFRLDNGIVARVYRRNRSIRADELRHLAKQFNKFYPEWQKQDGFASVAAVDPNLKIEHADKCDGSIDIINGDLAPRQFSATSLLSVKGWLAISTEKSLLPESAMLVLSDASGPRYLISTKKTPRPDVGAAFKDSHLDASGFDSTNADTSPLEGDYTLSLAYGDKVSIMLCPQPKIAGEFKGNRPRE